MNKHYIAGLIDGEGYLGLIPCKNKNLKNKSFEPVIKIGMTGIEAKHIFEQIVNLYGGKIESYTRTTSMGRQVYTFNIKSKKKVYNLLKDIQPYLYVKKAQAKLLIEFCNLPITHTRHANYNPKIVKRKEEIYQELKNLKLPQPLATTN